MRHLFGATLLVALASCGGGPGGGTAGGPTALLLTAGVETLQPAAGASAAPPEAQRFGVDGVEAVYDLTTPPGESFRFEMTVRSGGGGGATAVAVGHAADGGVAPAGGPETLGLAGVLPLAARLETAGLWLRAEGPGQARITVQGSITQEQTLLVECDDGASHGLVRIRLGAASAINRASGNDDVPGDPYAGIEDEATIHSSDAWEYGFPAVAQSGDRSTVIVYEGREKTGDAIFRERRLDELRLQVDRATGAVTGAPPTEVGWENGVFRDHEVAALDDVLAIARATTGGVRVEISFDRGATFGQAETFADEDAYAMPIVQADLASDYRLTVAFWRILVTGGGGGGGGTRPGDPAGAFDVPAYEIQLVLVEGRPSNVDGGGTPTAYAFGEPRVLFADGRDAAPTLMGVRATANGDLVVGYGFSRFEFRPEDNTVLATTEYRCATRIDEDGEFRDVLVHGEEIAAVDPSVDLEGAGGNLRILFACESSSGIRLFTSADGGSSFGLASEVEAAGAHMPTVCARAQGDALRVDLLYLAPTDRGLELRLRHWNDFDGAGEPVDARLVRATVETEEGEELSNDFFGDVVVRQVAPHGYDATEDGDDVVVVVHEETWRSRDVFRGLPFDPQVPDGDPSGEPPNRFALQASLAPGLTQPVPTPDPNHRHQLRVLSLD